MKIKIVSYTVLQTKGESAYKLKQALGLALTMTKRQHTVLLIDDSELIGAKVLMMLSAIPSIELLGQVKSVKEGLRACKEKTPDVLLLDINLPDGSGISLLKELKIRQPHIRVIMLTNSADSFYKHKCAELKAECLLDKTKEFFLISQLLTDTLQS